MQPIDENAVVESHRLARRIFRSAVRMAVVGGLLCGSLSLFQKSLQLWETERAMARQTVALQQELEATRQEHQRLREEKKFLETKAGVIAEARRLGYGFPGEIRLLPVPQESPAPAPHERIDD